MYKRQVTFSIDANGIVNVSAKDLDTGKAQQITITASSNMSREDIDRAVRDAQRYAAEDAKLKAEATARDRCEQMIFQAGNAKMFPKRTKRVWLRPSRLPAAPSSPRIPRR